MHLIKFRQAILFSRGFHALLACLLISLCSGCTQQEIADKEPLLIDLGEPPPCVKHPEMVPDTTMPRVQELRRHELKTQRDIDSLIDSRHLPEALALCEQLVEEQDACLGADNCDDAAVLRRVAEIHSLMGNSSAVVAAYKRILEIKVRYLGPQCIDTAFALRPLVLVLNGCAKSADAIALAKSYYQQAMQHHASTCAQAAYLYVLAEALEGAGQYKQACDTALHAVDLKEGIKPLLMVAPKPFALLLVAGRNAREAGDLDVAYDSVAKAAKLRFSVHQTEDKQFIQQLILLAQAWHNKGNNEGAEKSLRLAIELAISNTSLERSCLTEPWNALRHLLIASKRTQEVSQIDALVLPALSHYGSNR